MKKTIDWQPTTYTDSCSGPKSTDLKSDGAVMAVYYFCVVLAAAGAFGMVMTGDRGYAYVLCTGAVGVAVHLLGLYWPVIKNWRKL